MELIQPGRATSRLRRGARLRRGERISRTPPNRFGHKRHKKRKKGGPRNGGLRPPTVAGDTNSTKGHGWSTDTRLWFDEGRPPSRPHGRHLQPRRTPSDAKVAAANSDLQTAISDPLTTDCADCTDSPPGGRGSGHVGFFAGVGEFAPIGNGVGLVDAAD